MYYVYYINCDDVHWCDLSVHVYTVCLQGKNLAIVCDSPNKSIATYNHYTHCSDTLILFFLKAENFITWKCQLLPTLN